MGIYSRKYIIRRASELLGEGQPDDEQSDDEQSDDEQSDDE
jgi:hypothetical protein